MNQGSPLVAAARVLRGKRLALGLVVLLVLAAGSLIALFETERFAECRPLVEQLVRENPRHLLALDLLALCRMHAQEFAAAEATLRQRLALSEAADARLNLGLCRFEQGDREGALRELESAARLAMPHAATTIARRVLAEIGAARQRNV